MIVADLLYPRWDEADPEEANFPSIHKWGGVYLKGPQVCGRLKLSQVCFGPQWDYSLPTFKISRCEKERPLSLYFGDNRVVPGKSREWFSIDSMQGFFKNISDFLFIYLFKEKNNFFFFLWKHILKNCLSRKNFWIESWEKFYFLQSNLH